MRNIKIVLPTNKKIDIKFEWMLYVLLILPVAFLLINKFPYFLVLSVSVSVLLGLLFFLIKRSITIYHKDILGLLCIIYSYLLLSYFGSGQNITNLFSYDFLKNDGNFFFCYILFLCLLFLF